MKIPGFLRAKQKAPGTKRQQATNQRGCSTSSPPRLQARSQPERLMHKALIAHLGWRCPANTWWTHFPSGGARSRVTGALMKSFGTKAGVPDILILHRGQLYGLELKSAHGRLSDVQRQCHSDLRSAGATIGTAASLDEALALLGQWNITLRGTP